MYHQIRHPSQDIPIRIALTVTHLQRKSSSMSVTCNQIRKKLDPLLWSELEGTIWRDVGFEKAIWKSPTNRCAKSWNRFHLMSGWARSKTQSIQHLTLLVWGGVRILVNNLEALIGFTITPAILTCRVHIIPRCVSVTYYWLQGWKIHPQAGIHTFI